MKFTLDELTVYFPYEYIYPEQHAYMVELKKILDAEGHGLLEMPSGTGKTVTLLSLILAYHQAHPDRASKLVYCTRTVPEVDKTLAELKRLLHYREQASGERLEKFVGVGISSRKNLCINDQVLSGVRKGGNKDVDSRCLSLTASWVRERASQHPGEKISLCSFYENMEDFGHRYVAAGVYTMDDLKAYGRDNQMCPYFLARGAMQYASVIVYSYYYLLDPKVAELVSRELPRECIVVFDEAHNIDNVCIESLSVDLTRRTLDSASKTLRCISQKLSTARQINQQLLLEEYEEILKGIKKPPDSSNDVLMAPPIVSDDLLDEAIPGNVRKGEHFVAMMRRLIEFLKTRLGILHVQTDSPSSFLVAIKEAVAIERKPLRFASERLMSLIKTIESSTSSASDNIDSDYIESGALQKVANFATILATYSTGFILIMEPFDEQVPGVSNPVLRLACLDASIAIKAVFSRFRSVIITSGTLSPLEMYPKILDFDCVLQATFSISLPRPIFSPLIVTQGGDQVALTSRFDVRSEPAVVRNYGSLLVDFCRITPDGLVCFFPSYIYLEMIVAAWHATGVIQQASNHKLIFIETPDGGETSVALQNYRRACDTGRGAVLLCVARGKVSEGIDFDHHYGRAVIMFGVPYQYTESRVLKARLEFMREQYSIREGDFLSFDALRHAAQCLGRVIRGKSDYGIMILADRRYSRADKRAKLPIWIADAIQETHSALSTDSAVLAAQKFFREMAQPYDLLDRTSEIMLTEDDIHAKSTIKL